VIHRIRAFLALAVCLVFVCGPAAADGLVVITNPAVSLSPDDVRDVFLGEEQIAGGIKLVPVDNASAQVACLSQVIRLNATKYAATWMKKSFRDGVNPPAVKATDAEVVEFVKRVPGAVGYVTTLPGGGVNIVKMP
jgi:ABC-type phosphate transport system substrate-binding protein